MTKALPLCVDLDGTLVQSNTQWLAFCAFWSHRKWAAVQTAWDYMTRSRASAVTRLGQRYVLSAAQLPYNEPFLSELRKFKRQGVELFLATGASEAIAYAVAKHVSVFQGVFSSTDAVHLVGSAKAEALVAAFGERGFAYAGNSFQDIAVWRVAASIVVVQPEAGLLEELSRLGLQPDKVYP